MSMHGCLFVCPCVLLPGCRECAFQAHNTFEFDEDASRARVKLQWGDSETKIKVKHAGTAYVWLPLVMSFSASIVGGGVMKQ